MKAEFVIPGEPQGKARARTCKNGITFTPEKTVLYENLIKTCYAEQCAGAFFSTLPNSELKQPLHMEITAHFGIPKSYAKGRRLAAEHNIIRPTKKPDADNIAKVVCDVLNGVAYIDDTQIIDIRIRKAFGNPHVTVTIENDIEG